MTNLAHKLHFLGAMEKFFARRAKAKNDPVLLLGDLNVAPLEHDVWSHKQLLDVVSHTPSGNAPLKRRCRRLSTGPDATRHFIPENEKIYSWVELVARRTGKPLDRGRRLDHVWLSPGLKGALEEETILKEYAAAGRKQRRITCR